MVTVVSPVPGRGFTLRLAPFTPLSLTRRAIRGAALDRVLLADTLAQERADLLGIQLRVIPQGDLARRARGIAA